MLTVLICLGSLAAGPESFVPDGFGEGWTKEGAAELYDAENLFEYINGEAELYYPYGFKQLASVAYRTAGEKPQGIQADVYEMGSLLDAFGLYSNFRRPEGERAGVGTDDYVTATQLVFYQDRYFVRLARSGRESVAREAFAELGKAIAEEIRGDSEPPKELAWLAVEGVVPGTEKYIAQSVLGYDFFPKGLTAEVKLGEEQKARVFVVMTESVEAAHEALRAYVHEVVESGGTLSDRDARDGRFAVADPLHGGVMILPVGPYFAGLAGIQASPDKASDVLRHKGASKLLTQLADKLPGG